MKKFEPVIVLLAFACIVGNFIWIFKYGVSLQSSFNVINNILLVYYICKEWPPLFNDNDEYNSKW